jgi:phage portal protein BeeE
MTAKRETLSNEAGQYDETRKFQITEVSRLFCIDPTKLFEMGRATWGNLGELNSDYWDTTCRRWATKIEAEIRRKLLFPNERKKYAAEFDTDLLLRGDRTTRYANYKVGIEAGFLDVETVCGWESIPVPEPKPEPKPEPQPMLP